MPERMPKLAPRAGARPRFEPRPHGVLEQGYEEFAASSKREQQGACAQGKRASVRPPQFARHDRSAPTWIRRSCCPARPAQHRGASPRRNLFWINSRQRTHWKKGKFHQHFRRGTFDARFGKIFGVHFWTPPHTRRPDAPADAGAATGTRGKHKPEPWSGDATPQTPGCVASWAPRRTGVSVVGCLQLVFSLLQTTWLCSHTSLGSQTDVCMCWSRRVPAVLPAARACHGSQLLAAATAGLVKRTSVCRFRA